MYAREQIGEHSKLYFDIYTELEAAVYDRDENEETFLATVKRLIGEHEYQYTTGATGYTGYHPVVQDALDHVCARLNYPESLERTKATILEKLRLIALYGALRQRS